VRDRLQIPEANERLLGKETLRLRERFLDEPGRTPTQMREGPTKCVIVADVSMDPRVQVLGVTAPPCRIDSQAKYGAMARGDAAIYLRFPHAGYREKIWDHAAGCCVIEGAAGQVVSDVMLF
jgi:3'-phosphoadenosine 5'-phosphosulfate (PAPS) 3'-phosphatase